MTKEINPINQLPTDQLIQQRDKTLETIEKRQYHIGLIGQCKIKEGSSFENTLEIGRRRADAKGRLEQDQSNLDGINQELTAYNQAKQYLEEISLKQTQLDEMSQMVAQGNLFPQTLEKHQKEYQEFALLSETDPFLIKGIARIRQEEERKEKPPESKPTEDYKLTGKSAQLIERLKESSPNNLISSSQLTEEIWPGILNNKARDSLCVLVSLTNKKLQKIGSDSRIVVISDSTSKIKGEKAKYYLTKMGQSDQFFEPNQPTETSKSPKDIVADETLQTKEDEEIDLINKPEFGTLSRVDINTIASAIDDCRYFLEPILKTSSVDLIEKNIVSELSDITGEISPADSKKMTVEQYRNSLDKFRAEALQKAKDLIESPEADKILEEIYTQNPNVWYLLVNLSEMNDKLKGLAINGDNYYHKKRGITFLTNLVNDEETRWTYYVTDNQGNELERTLDLSVKAPPIVCSGKN